MVEYLSNIFAFNEDSPLMFTQFEFWVFFAVVMVFVALLRNKLLMRNAFLFAASVFFYYKTSGMFTLLLLFAIVASFYMGKLVYKTSEGWKRNLVLSAGIVINLGVLSYFKYAYFIADMLNKMS